MLSFDPHFSIGDAITILIVLVHAAVVETRLTEKVKQHDRWIEKTEKLIHEMELFLAFQRGKSEIMHSGRN